MSTSMEATLNINKENSFQNTSFLKISNLYIPA